MIRQLCDALSDLFCPKSSGGAFRLILVLIGAGILFLSVIPIGSTAITAVWSLIKPPAKTAETAATPEALPPHSPPGGWPQHGIDGTYDRAALQRGFQVYKEVCSTCHSMKLLSYRDLTQLGFKENEVKAIASNYQVQDGPNDQGEMYQRQARPSDHFVSPFANDQAARAAEGGALPPDLSLIIKARKGHEDYVYSILTGFDQTPPANESIMAGMNYNPYFPGHQIAMPPPLREGAISFADGTPATVDQMARDVVQYLAWASEPHLEDRHQTGIKVILFLIAFAGVMYGVKKKIWSRLHK